MIEFAAPQWFALLPLPYLAWLATRRYGRVRRGREASPALLHSDADLLAGITAPGARAGMPGWWLCGCLLLIAALARPEWPNPARPVIEPGRNIMLAIDVSDSMRTRDYRLDGAPANRLEAVKRSAARLLESLRGARLGIVAFADDAMTFLPLTTDLRLAAALLQEFDEGITGGQTALGDALGLAVERLRAAEPASRILILLSDGTNTAGDLDPEAAAGYAAAEGVRIYAIGVGPAPDSRIAAAAAPEERLLRHIAAATNGGYYRAESAADMERILADIDRLEQVAIERGIDTPGRQLYWLPLVAGLLCLLVHERRRQGMPS